MSGSKKQLFSVDSLRPEFEILVKELVDGGNIQLVIQKYEQVVIPSCEIDVKNIVDLAFREVLRDLLAEKAETAKLTQIINKSVEAAEADVCAGNLPLTLLSDLFDCVTLDKCEELFSLVEDRVDIWKKDFFFKNCKNQLLRSCNDLLRRLSRSQNTVFCGRILVFLARFFPLSERSGLNIISEFNLDNVTLFSTRDDVDLASEKDDNMEEGEMDDTTTNFVVDYNIYRKFWSLQDFFRQPTICYNKVSWRHFSSYASDVLSAFGSFKLDDIHVKSTNWKIPEGEHSGSGKHVYFAKYLTSQKLLELELSDSNFRRYVLIQFLILFQYLQSSIKFKQEAFVLTEDQVNWVKDTTISVYKLLGETPPDGEPFAKNVQHILKREEYWSNWKNEGCPNFKDVQSEAKSVNRPARQKRRLGDEIREAVACKQVVMGNSELNRLWNLCPDNWEACRSQKRDFVPSLDKYFDSAIEQADPANQIESRYKSVNDGNFAWRALRLLSQKSPHFFTQSNQPIFAIPRYLENMVCKLAKELPQQSQQSQVVAEDTKHEAVAGGEDNEDELLQNPEETTSKTDNSLKEDNLSQELVTKDYLNQVAEEVKKSWKSLAAKLGFPDDEIQYFATENQDVVAQARLMLMVWMETGAERATVAALKVAMKKAGINVSL